MRDSINRAFFAAEAIVGVVLTIFWLTKQWPPHAIFTPLSWIGASLLLVALVMAVWGHASNRGVQTIEENTPSRPRAAARSCKLRTIVSQNRRPIELALIAAFVFITALLIHYGTPLPGA